MKFFFFFVLIVLTCVIMINMFGDAHIHMNISEVKLCCPRSIPSP